MVGLQGHYRYCEALFFLGEVKMAIEANNSAQSLCKDDLDGIKDLEQQYQKFGKFPALTFAATRQIARKCQVT